LEGYLGWRVAHWSESGDGKQGKQGRRTERSASLQDRTVKCNRSYRGGETKPGWIRDAFFRCGGKCFDRKLGGRRKGLQDKKSGTKSRPAGIWEREGAKEKQIGRKTLVIE